MTMTDGACSWLCTRKTAEQSLSSSPRPARTTFRTSSRCSAISPPKLRSNGKFHFVCCDTSRSSVRHQQYHDADIVTSAWKRQGQPGAAGRETAPRASPTRVRVL